MRKQKVTKEKLLKYGAIEKAYGEYCLKEFDEWRECGSSVLGLMFTSVGENEEYDVQVSYDLEKEQLITWLGNQEESYEYREKYEIRYFLGDLETSDFQYWYGYAHDVVEDKFGLEDIEF